MGWEHKLRNAAAKAARLQKEDEKMEKTLKPQLQTVEMQLCDMQKQTRNRNNARADFECIRALALMCHNENQSVHKCKRGEALLDEVLEIARECQMALAWM